MTDRTLTSKTNHGNSDVAVAGCNCEACFNLRGELVNSHCAECGMALITAGEYHPYAACALYKQWGDSHAVRANLAAIIEHGNKPTGNETRAPQRYALGAEGDICGAIPVMNEEAAGDWVHWGDVKHLFEANAQKANSCVCGEPNSPGTHRTDGPCLAPIGDRR